MTRQQVEQIRDDMAELMELNLTNRQGNLEVAYAFDLSRLLLHAWDQQAALVKILQEDFPGRSCSESEWNSWLFKRDHAIALTVAPPPPHPRTPQGG